MAFFFGDSFDFYSSVNDATLNYWDSGGVASSVYTLVAGRFAGSQAISFNNSTAQIFLTKSSGANDAIHHFILSFRQTAALSGTTLSAYLQLLDGTTNQCCIVFRSDGAMLLTSGGPAGTVLATYATAVNVQNAWIPFEIEVVIHNTAGSITVRKNGNVGAPDFTLGSLNTRGGTANNYANKLSVGVQGQVNQHQLDDLLWRSDPTSVAWLGDIRAYQQMPASDVSDQFAQNQSLWQVTPFIPATTATKAANLANGALFTASQSGTISSVILSLSAGATGNMKAAIYDGATRNTVLATSNAVVNPVTGNNTFTFATPLVVTRGTSYLLVFDQDTTVTYNTTGANNQYYSATITYASFPTSSPGFTNSSSTIPIFTVNIVPANSSLINEAQEDGAASYVYDTVVGHADLYAMTPLASTPQSIIAVTIRGFMAKSDAGTRAGQLQLKSGATTVQSAPLFLSTSFLWNYRTDTVDPNTGLAWTAAAVNAAQIGPVVQT